MTHWHTPQDRPKTEMARRKQEYRSALNRLLAETRVAGERAAFLHAYGLAQRTNAPDELLDMLRALSQGTP